MIKSIDSQELFRKKEANDDFLLIDCREQDEWNTAHIEFAEFIPLSDFENGWNRFIESNGELKNKQIIVQCRSGKRSMNVCQFLSENGYKDLTNLSDGILGWQANKFPMIGDGVIE